MLTLIDGNSLVFRAYYGVHANLTRSDGMPVGAVYGFFNMILPILANANLAILLFAYLMHQEYLSVKIFIQNTKRIVLKLPRIY